MICFTMLIYLYPDNAVLSVRYSDRMLIPFFFHIKDRPFNSPCKVIDVEDMVDGWTSLSVLTLSRSITAHCKATNNQLK